MVKKKTKNTKHKKSNKNYQIKIKKVVDFDLINLGGKKKIKRTSPNKKCSLTVDKGTR